MDRLRLLFNQPFDRFVLRVWPLASVVQGGIPSLVSRVHVCTVLLEQHGRFQCASFNATQFVLKHHYIRKVHDFSRRVTKLITKAPYRGFALALQRFYPDAMRPKAAAFAAGPEGLVHPSARIEAGAVIEPGAVVGREAQIGRGTTIAAGAVVGYRVTIGRDSYIGAGASVTHALLGDRVLIHAGVRIGQDGFGFAMGPRGHLKVPQVGRVIIQDDVEIGANTTIDRGALRDTIIGEGTKIDNLVQIGHNVIIGRHCVIVGQVGIAGSAELGDFVVMGGHSGVVGHVKVGSGAQIAGSAHVKDDLAPGARVAGTPAVPFKEFARGLAVVSRLARRGGATAGDADKD